MSNSFRRTQDHLRILYMVAIVVLMLGCVTAAVGQNLPKMTLPSGQVVTLGWIPDPPEVLRAHQVQPWQITGVLGRGENLRAAADNSANMPPVGNQGGQGSCASWATGYYHKGHQEWQEHGWDQSNASHQFSPAFLYNQVRVAGGGSSLGGNMQLMVDKGCATMADFPFDEHDDDRWPKSTATWLTALDYRADSYSALPTSNDTELNALKTLIDNGGTFCIGFTVYSDFYTKTLDDDFYEGPDSGADVWGGHGICIVGYDDDKDAGDGDGITGGFKFVNSWGAAWAGDGYAWLSYDFFKTGDVSWAYFMTDKIGYSPDSWAAFEIDHGCHADLTVTVENANGMASVTPFDQTGHRADDGDDDADLYAVVDLTDEGAYLPATHNDPWYLTVQDKVSGESGTIQHFSITSPGNYVESFATPQTLADLSTVQLRTPTNHVPSVDSVSISPDPPVADDTLTATPSGWDDADGDPENYDWQWHKEVGGSWQNIPGATSDTLASSQFTGGDHIRVECTPNDGIETGAPVYDDVTVQNSPPSVDSVAIEPDPATTNNTLTAVPGTWTDIDGDPESYNYQWQKENGTWEDLTGETNDTLDSSNFQKGDHIRVACTPDDGQVEGDTVYDDITISNAAPSQPDVDVTPDQPYTTEDLTVAASGSTDADGGDTVSYAYQWYKDGVHQGDYDDATTIPASATTKGEVWRCDVTPSDGTDNGPVGSDSVTIQNSAPSQPDVDVTPDDPQTGDNLSVSASGSTDADDGDTVIYRYEWYKDGVHQPSYDAETTIPSSATAKGEVWECQVTATDGEVSSTVGSDSETIQNTAPNAPTVSIDPAEPTSQDDITASASGDDPDDDPLTFSYAWYKDGTHQPAYDDQQTVPASALSKGETWECRVIASDGTEDSAPGSASVTIQSAPPTQPTVTITPADPLANDTLEVSVSDCTDPDDDPITYSYRWYQLGSPQGAYDDETQIPASATAKGDVWRCEVTPSDGTADGPMGTASVTINNSPPEQPTVDVTPDDPTTQDDLSVTASADDPDEETLTYSYRWTKDGVAQPDYDDETTVPSSATSEGETWECEVIANDGDADSPPATDAVTIGNSPPSAPDVDVTPDKPVTDDDLSVTATATDPDGEAVTYNYTWYKDGVHQADYDGQTTVPASATSRGETWRCEVTANDGTTDGPAGSDSVTIGNTGPTQPTVEIAPDDPATGDDLTVTASGSTDPDGDTVEYSYKWYRDGRYLSEYNDETTVPASETSEGETWRCEVTPSDGEDDGPVGSDEVGIVNAPPTEPTVTISPDNPATDDDLTASASGSTDPDGDPITYSYTWYRDGTHVADYDDETVVPSSATTRGETWRCEVTANDGQQDSAVGSEEVTIENSAPTQPTVDVTPDDPADSDDLAVDASGSTDPDEDAVDYKYEWYKNDQHQPDYDDETTVDAAATAAGETWKCVVTPTDGDMEGPTADDSVTIGCSVEITAGPEGTPNPVPSGWPVECTVSATDALGHDLTYRWRATDGDGNEVGWFKDRTGNAPTWYPPKNQTDETMQVTIAVTATCTEGRQATAQYVQEILPEPETIPAPVPYICVDDHPDDQGTALDLCWPKSPDDGADTPYEMVYHIFRKPHHGTFRLIESVPATGQDRYNYTDNNLQRATLYMYAVTAANAKGGSEARYQWRKTVDNLADAPEPVTNLEAHDRPGDTGNAILVKWDASASENADVQAAQAGPDPVQKYFIFRRRYHGGTFIFVNEVPADGSDSYEFTDTTCTSGHVLQYAVRAYDGNKQSVPVFDNATAFENSAPFTPRNFVAVNMPDYNGRSVHLQWDASLDDGRGSDDVKEYWFWRRQLPDGEMELVGKKQADDSPSYVYLDLHTLSPGTTYEYYLRAWDGQNQSDIATARVQTVDETAPQPPIGAAAEYLGQQQVRVTWNASPDDGGGVDDVTSYRIWRKMGTGDFEMLEPVPATDAATYEHTDSTATEGVLCIYLIEAWDGQNRSDQAYAQVRTDAIGIAHVFAAKADPYMIGLPGGATVNTGSVAYYDAEGGELVAADGTVAGQGYVAKFDRAVETAAVPDNGVVTYPVRQGWNLIASPFTEPIGFDGAEGPILPYAWTDQGDGYELAAALDQPGVSQMLQPWQSYWVYAESDGELTFRKTAETSGVQSVVDGDGWLVQLVAQADGDVDACNWIGAGSSNLAIPNPPQLSNGVDLHIAADEPMAASTQAAAPEMSWDVVVTSATDEPVTLTFPDLSAVPNKYRLTLVDEAAGKTTNMRTSNGYTVRGSAKLTITATEGNGNTLTVSGVSTQQIGSQATIAYTLSADANVTVDIRNIAGRTISRIPCGSETAGVNSATWNLRNTSGAVVPSGTYLCTITARSDDGTQTSAVRTMRITR
ncbi:MAG: FlgD immunoglobulin-like domain containing protein [Armatimonadota bacterium]